MIYDKRCEVCDMPIGTFPYIELDLTRNGIKHHVIRHKLCDDLERQRFEGLTGKKADDSIYFNGLLQPKF